MGEGAAERGTAHSAEHRMRRAVHEDAAGFYIAVLGAFDGVQVMQRRSDVPADTSCLLGADAVASLLGQNGLQRRGVFVEDKSIATAICGPSVHPADVSAAQ